MTNSVQRFSSSYKQKLNDWKVVLKPNRLEIFHITRITTTSSQDGQVVLGLMEPREEAILAALGCLMEALALMEAIFHRQNDVILNLGKQQGGTDKLRLISIQLTMT